MNINLLKDIFQIGALASAACFFVYKAVTGYLRVNLSLSIECRRQRHQNTDDDNLVVCVRLKKGGNGSLALHDAKAQVFYGSVKHIASFPGIRRSARTNTDPKRQRQHIDLPSEDANSPFLKLVAGEETELATALKVPRSAVCEIEVAILGRQVHGFPFGQWKASCVSLPSINP